MGKLRIIRTGETYYDFDAGHAMLGWRDGKPFYTGNVRPDQIKDEIANAIRERNQTILWLETWQKAFTRK